MKIPNNKKYLLYVKTAKTGRSAFVEYLSSIKLVKYCGTEALEGVDVIEGDIIVVPQNLKLFKHRYPDIFNDSYKIMLARNPYTRVLSAYNYHPACKNKSFNYLLKN